MGSTTSSDYHRCSFNATDVKSWHGLASCVICTRATLCAKMIRCVACRRLAHKKCIRGALRSDQRDGQHIGTKNHYSPAATSAFGTWTTADGGSIMTGDSSAHTRMTTRDIACGDGGITFVEVACGNGGVTSAEVACGDSGVTSVDVACGDDGVTSVEVACGDGGVTSAEVACGDDGVKSAEECTQTYMMTTCVNSFTQTNVATRPVASGVEAEHVNRYSQTGVAASDITCDTVRVQGPTQTDVASSVKAHHADVPKTSRTMAQMMAQMFDTTTTTASTSHTSTAPVQLKSNAQKSQLYRTYTFWKQRYTLFSKFDEGIMLDEVCLCSTCPEVLAKHMAKKYSVRTVLDPFCGAGANAIQLALTCHHVIAIDVDPRKIALARKNAEVYGVADRISFRVGDSFLEAANLRVDAVVTSPPREKPVDCKWRTAFDARALCSRESGGMAAILRMARAAAPKVLLNVPRNIVKAQYMQMAMKEGFNRVHYESIVIDGKPNSLNLYFTLRNDSSEQKAPIQTSTEVNLSTPPLLERQLMECARDNKMSVYASYLDWVTRFLDA